MVSASLIQKLELLSSKNSGLRSFEALSASLGNLLLLTLLSVETKSVLNPGLARVTTLSGISFLPRASRKSLYRISQQSTSEENTAIDFLPFSV